MVPDSNLPDGLEAEQLLELRPVVPFYRQREPVGDHEQVDAEVEAGPSPHVPLVHLQHPAAPQAARQEGFLGDSTRPKTSNLIYFTQREQTSVPFVVVLINP